MSAGRSQGGGDEDTPKTRSYVNALLQGELSERQMAELRAEIAGRAGEGSVPPPRSQPPSSRSRPPSSVPAPRPPSSVPRPPSSMPRPPSYRPPSSRPYEPHDEDDQRTVARSYLPPPDEDDQRTVVRSYAPPPEEFELELPTAPAEEEDDDDGAGRTAVHVYTPAEMSDLVDLGDFGDIGLPVLEPVPEAATGDTDGAEQRYLAALGGVAGVPRLAIEPAQVVEVPLGPQAAFVLSRIDGGSSVEDVIDMSGFGRNETLRILYDLLEQGVICVEGGG